MGDKSGKHGARLDEEMRRETQGLRRSGGPVGTRPWDDPEPVDTDGGLDPTSTRAARKGSPPGLTAEEVEERSTVASVLAGVQYPADPRRLAAHAESEGAPDIVVTRLAGLQDGSYTGLPAILRALGIGHEERRT